MTDTLQDGLGPSAPMMAKQCQDAYAVLYDAEAAYLDAAHRARCTLEQPEISAAMQARAHWLDAVEAAASATDRLGDAGLRPEDLALGHAVVDCVDRVPYGWPPADGDLAALPDGTLWVGQDGRLVDSCGTRRMGVEEFRTAGGVAFTRGERWAMAEEALASRFPEGSRITHPARGLEMTVTRPPAWDPISANDCDLGAPTPWRVNLYHPEGMIHADQNWWMADFLEPI